METMLMQNFGGTNKGYYGIFGSGLFYFLCFRGLHDSNQNPRFLVVCSSNKTISSPTENNL